MYIIRTTKTGKAKYLLYNMNRKGDRSSYLTRALLVTVKIELRP